MWGVPFHVPTGALAVGSWAKVVSNLKDHFGETVEIDDASKGVIEKYLIDNAAEKSLWKRSRKTVSFLKGETPLRITEVPYIRRKHRNIPPEVFTRKSVGARYATARRATGQGIKAFMKTTT
jgi:hypothetical protein